MKTAVIYRSKSGFVKNYALMLSDALTADVFNGEKVDFNELENYDTLIFGGGLYAVGINGLKFIKQAMETLRDKKIIVFACGASPPSDEIHEEVFERNFDEEERKKIKFYYLRGGFQYDRCTFKDKILMRLLKFKLNKKENLTPDEKGMLAAYSKPVDFTNKKNISEIVCYVKSLQ
jgi:menaquinone-dependent protoporphyrinogen IX oxidase